LILKRREMTADRGQRHADTASRGRQAAGLSNGDKYLDCGEPIHASFQIMEEYIPFLLATTGTGKSASKPRRAK
jgi:hypothetical protein